VRAAAVRKIQVIWHLEDDLEGNVQHIAEHDVTLTKLK
jgi:hypothetical protein